AGARSTTRRASATYDRGSTVDARARAVAGASRDHARVLAGAVTETRRGAERARARSRRAGETPARRVGPPGHSRARLGRTKETECRRPRCPRAGDDRARRAAR